MKFRNRALVFLFFFSGLTYVDRLAIAVAGPDMQKDLGLSSSQFGWILGSFALAYGLFGVPAGFTCDRIGPRRFITITTLCLSLFTAMTGAVRSFVQLFAVRFIFGASGAGVFPSCSATISRWFPFGERARAQGVVLMASRFGGAVTPLFVVPLIRAYGWHGAFYAFGLTGLVFVPLWHAWFRDRAGDKKGITTIELAEIDGARGSRSIPPPPFTWKEALSRPNLWWIMLMYYTYCWSAYFYLSWLYTFLEKGRGYSKADVVALSWIPFVFGAVTNILGGYCSDHWVKRIGLKWGRRCVGLVGLGASTLFIGAAYFAHGKVACVILLSLGFAASDFMNPTAWAVCLDIGGKAAGTVTGAMNMAGQAGSFCSAVAFGYLVDAWHSYDLPLLPIACLTAVSALIWLKIDPTHPLIRSPGPATAVT